VFPSKVVCLCFFLNQNRTECYRKEKDCYGKDKNKGLLGLNRKEKKRKEKKGREEKKTRIE